MSKTYKEQIGNYFYLSYTKKCGNCTAVSYYGSEKHWETFLFVVVLLLYVQNTALIISRRSSVHVIVHRLNS